MKKKKKKRHISCTKAPGGAFSRLDLCDAETLFTSLFILRVDKILHHFESMAEAIVGRYLQLNHQKPGFLNGGAKWISQPSHSKGVSESGFCGNQATFGGEPKPKPPASGAAGRVFGKQRQAILGVPPLNSILEATFGQNQSIKADGSDLGAFPFDLCTTPTRGTNFQQKKRKNVAFRFGFLAKTTATQGAHTSDGRSTRY